MDPAKVKAALDALINGDTEACASILKDMIAVAAGGGEETPPAADAGAALGDAADEPKPGDEQKAALAALTALTGKASAGEAVAFLSKAIDRLAKVEAREAALELSSRRELVADLVKLGAETPATAWEGKAEDRNPCKRLSAEPIDDLRERVEALSKANPGQRKAEPPPREEPVKQLSKAERDYCAKHSITPEQFEARKAGIVRVHAK